MGEERSANITPEDKHTKNQAGFAIVGIGKLAEDELLPAFKKCGHATVAAALIIMNAIYRSAAEQRVIHLESSLQKDLYRRRHKIEGKEPA